MDNQVLCIIILVLVIIFILLYLLYKVKKDGLRATAVHLITVAETMFTKGANKQKMDYVVEKLIAMLPIPLQFFITADAVENFVQCVFDEIKEALDYEPEKLNM